MDDFFFKMEDDSSVQRNVKVQNKGFSYFKFGFDLTVDAVVQSQTMASDEL
jgi:hypothetical protein